MKLKFSQFSFSMRPSIVTIFFRDQQVTLLKRIEVYSYTDFMAVCGGLLGLFLGVSVLSIVEFLYYSTLRLYWTLRRWKSESIIVPLNSRPINHISIDLPDVYNGKNERGKSSPFKRPNIIYWHKARE